MSKTYSIKNVGWLGIVSIAGLVLLIVLLSNPAYGQITSNVLLRTFFIQTLEEYGSAFTIEVDDRQYLITAKHLVKSYKHGSKATIKFLNADLAWKALEVTVLKTEDPIDIAVLVPPEQLSVAYNLEPTTSGLALGQDVFFVGYPHGRFQRIPISPTLLGFVRKASVSQLQFVKPRAQIIWLDGVNNLGYSGSPVVFRDISIQGYDYKVAGVISGYLNEDAAVLRKVEISESTFAIMKKSESYKLHISNGKYYMLVPTNEVAVTNSGLAFAWSIESAITLIKQNPIGPKVNLHTEGK